MDCSAIGAYGPFAVRRISRKFDGGVWIAFLSWTESTSHKERAFSLEESERPEKAKITKPPNLTYISTSNISVFLIKSKKSFSERFGPFKYDNKPLASFIKPLFK